jgi:tetratricopeptide (TPR) repeat protein
VYSGQSAHEKALAVASAVPRDSPRSREARFAAGLSLLELRRYDAAALELAALHREQPAAAVSNALGIVALRRGARDAAATPASYFRRAVEEAPGMADYLFNLGYAQAIAGDRANALLWLREAVRVGPANGDAHLVMSAVLAAAGRAVEAGRELDLARLLGSAAPVPAAPEPGVPAGLERVRGDLDASPVDRARVWTNAPASEDQHEAAAFELARGRRFVEAGRDREAADALRRAVYLAPYEDEAHLLLGRLYRRAGRLQDAIDEFKVALWCRETAAARVALGDALFDSGDRDGARREADRALALQPGDADARMLLARIGGGPPMLPSPEFHD